MADYCSLRKMMDSTENMERLVLNTAHDDDVIAADGADWLLFNGERADKIYVSGNSFLGLGKNAEHLLVCRRDTKMYNLYREEATLFGSIKVLKLRWEGYAQYNSTSEEAALKYEWFFFDTGDIFLNLVCPPKNSGYLGASKINAGSTIDITVTAGESLCVTFRHLDDEGMTFEAVYDVPDIKPPFERKYLLCDKDNVYYRPADDGTLETVEIEDLTADAFSEHGFETLPENELLMQLENPTLLYWQDSQTELPEITAELHAVPPPQTVFSKNNIMTDSTVFGIEKVGIDSDDTALFAFSFDGGKSWKTYLDGRWGLLSEAASGMSKTAVEEIGTDAWAEAVTDNQYMVRFTLFEGGYVKKIIIYYVN